MSVLTLPRINFFGKTEWNPDTSNNYDSLYDSATAEPNFKDTGTTPQTYLQYLKEHSAGMGNWNVYGDQATTFVDTKVSSVALQGGKSDPEDPLMNRPIQILGLAWSDNQAPPARLVDVDPYSSTTSQLFFDSFQIGDDEVGVIGKRLQRFSDREFFFARNLNLDNKVQIAGGMGVTWQTAFHKDELTWNGVELSTALSVLKAAVDATGSNGGMVVRFANYRTDYFTNCSYKGQSITDFAQLQAAYLDGFEGFNPAYSIVIGSVGVWQEGESITGPNDRVLIPKNRVPLLPPPTGVELAAASAVVTPSAIPLARIGHKTLFPEDLAAAAAAAAARQVAVGPAQAKVTFNTDGSDTVVFDFVNTFPETTQELTKANLGSFLLQVQDPNDATQVITIGKKPLTYDDYKKDPYEANAGIYTFSFDPGHANAITSGLLQLVSEADPSKVILLEQEVVASTVLKNFYLDEHQVVEVDLQVADKGSTAATVGTFVAIAQYNANNTLIKNAANRSEPVEKRVSRSARSRPVIVHSPTSLQLRAMWFHRTIRIPGRASPRSGTYPSTPTSPRMTGTTTR